MKLDRILYFFTTLQSQEEERRRKYLLIVKNRGNQFEEIAAQKRLQQYEFYQFYRVLVRVNLHRNNQMDFLNNLICL